ncbi:hypothetical protein [Spiroplasma endosymbiont of Notiophilus biguttatus]|uniref:hypothetical protein n=1 Tax=Spiroplasma endosymbiont of Notiophilus biguttatus TaxID=3066285 RepID=UPI00313B9733
MDDNILDILGLQLVDYFISHQDYRPFNVPKELKLHAKGEVYLTNKDSNTYHIIKIIKENNFNPHHLKNKDEVYEILHKHLANEGVKDIRYLMVILNDDNQNENRMSPAVDVIIATSDKIVQELSKFYPSITKFIKVDLPQLETETENNEETNEDNSSGTLSDNWKKVNFQNRRYLSETLKKCTNSNLAVTWFLFIIPIITLVVFLIIINLNQDDWLALDYNQQHLLFGANYHNLIFGAYQYWRWLIYPFAGNDINPSAPINLIFSLWMFYRVGRFVEGFYGWWKAIFIWIGAMILTGILQSVVDNINIMSGFWVFPVISLGAMLPFIWNYKLFKTPIMSRFFTTILLMLIFWFITDQQVLTLLYWMIAFVTGWLFASLIGYHNHKITVYYAFSPIAIGSLVLFAGLLWGLNNYYPVDDNNYTLEILKQYQKLGLISQSTIKSIMLNYFHIQV